MCESVVILVLMNLGNGENDEFSYTFSLCSFLWLTIKLLLHGSTLVDPTFLFFPSLNQP